MDNDTVDKVIEILEVVAARPALYYGNSSDYRGLLTFLEGFHCCLNMLEFAWPTRTDFPEVLKRRGWSDYLTIDELKSKGLSDEEIASELLAVEIDIWKSFRQKLNQ